MSTFQKVLSVNSIVALTWIFGLINNIAITGVFGLSRMVDAYFAAYMLVNLFIILVVDFLGKNFLPIYAIRRESSKESASTLTSIVVTQVGLASFVVAGLLVLLSRPLFDVLLPGFNQEEIGVTAATFLVMAPCIAIKSINAFHEYVWQHEEQYNRVVVARIFVPITLTIFILALGSQIGPKVLPYGFLVGNLLSALFLMIHIPYRFKPKFGFSDEDFRKIVRNSGILIGTGFIARSRAIVVQYFGSQLGEGAISALAIAQKICVPVYQGALLGIRMILFSRSTKALARSDFEGFARMHNLAFAGVFFLTIPVAAWYAFEGNLIVSAVFQRGEFTDSMVVLVATALLGHSLSVSFSGAVQMASNAFYALDRITVPASIMPLGTLLFVAIASVLVPSYGVLGLAGTTSVVSVIVFALLLTLLRKQVSSLAVISLLKSIGIYTGCALIAVISARYLRSQLEAGTIIEFLASAMLVGVIYTGACMDKSGKEFPSHSGKKRCSPDDWSLEAAAIVTSLDFILLL